MPSKHVRLSDKAARVLTAIAQGHTYEQVLARDRTLTYLDIFAAAREALAVAAQPAGDGGAGVADSAKKPGKTLAAHRQAHPRAYERWGDAEEARLARLVQAGRGVREIATLLQRQPTRDPRPAGEARSLSSERRGVARAQFAGT